MAYRDGQQALTQRLVDLEARLAAMHRAQASAQEMAAEEKRALDEMHALRKQLAPTAAELKRRLPMLQQIYVASPCDVPWDAMPGTEKTRYCDQCDKQVHNLSAMTTPEAEALLAASCDTPLCLRIYRRDDGTVLTADCPVGLRRKQRRRLAAGAAVVLTLSTSFASAMALLKTGRAATAQTSVQSPVELTPVFMPPPSTQLAQPSTASPPTVAPPTQPLRTPPSGGVRNWHQPPQSNPLVSPRPHTPAPAPAHPRGWVLGGEG